MGMFLRRGAAPSLGTPIGDLDIGSIVKLNVDGTPWEFLVVHQGLPSSMYDASCEGTWLLMKDCYERRAWDSSNSNKYNTSTINTYLNGDFFAKFDSAVQDAIKQVIIPYGIGNKTSLVYVGAKGVEVKVFLLSICELGLTSSDYRYIPDDGAKLDYFTASSAGNSKRIATISGSACIWFTRSPNTNYATDVWCIGKTGSRYDDATRYDDGIRPALILPPEFLVSSDMLA